MWIEIVASIVIMATAGTGAALGCWIAHLQWERKFNREHYNSDGSLR